MAETIQQQSPETAGDGQHRSAADNIRELTEASKHLLDAGKQLTENLSELSKRVEHAKNFSSEALKSPWLFAGAAVVAGAVILLVSRRD